MQGRNHRKSGKGILIAAAAVAGLAHAGYANDATWNGADSFWNAANWTSGGNAYTPAASDNLFFAGTGPTSTNNNFPAATGFGSLSFLTGSQAYTFDGNDIALTGPIINNAGNGSVQTFNFGFTAGGGISLGTDNSSGNSLAVNANSSAAGLTVLSQNITTPNTLAIGTGRTLSITGLFSVGTVVTNGGTTPFTAALTVTGNGTLSIVNSSTFSFLVGRGQTANGATGSGGFGTLDLSGLSNFSYSTSTGTIGIGVGTRGVGVLTLANAANSLTAPTMNVGVTGGGNNGGASTVNFGAGSNAINVDNILIGGGKAGGLMQFAGANGSINIAGSTGGASTSNITLGSGTSATNGAGVSGLLLAGHQANVQGGTIVVGRLAGSTGGSAAAGSITFDTGIFNVNSLQLAVHSSGNNGSGAFGAFTLGGPSANSTATGVLNVNNQFLMVNRTTAGTVATATFNINAGTANINTDITTVDSSPGSTRNAFINLNAGTLNMTGHAIGSAALPISLVADGSAFPAVLKNLGGTGLNGFGLLKNSGGTLLLDGNNTYSGTTAVSSGTLQLSAGATIASPVFEVRNGGNLNLTNLGAPQIPANRTLSGDGVITEAWTIAGAIAPGNNSIPGSTAGQLTFNNNVSLSGGGTLNFELSNNTGGGNDGIAVNGTLDLAGTTSVRTTPISGAYANGDYTLMTYTTKTGAGNLVLASNLIARQTFTLNVGANATTLSVSGNSPANITWVGNGTTNVWDHTTTLWDNGGPDKFFDLDNVNFTDSGSASPNINLTGALAPAAMTVDSGANDYTFSGNGSLSAFTLTKNNSRNITFANSGNNTFGTVSINGGGMLLTGTGATTVSNQLTVNGGSTLTVGDGVTAGAGNLSAATLNNNGSVILNRPDSYTFTSNMSGGGSLQKLGAGKATITGTNSYGGPTRISGGTLSVTSLANGGTVSSIGSSGNGPENLVIDGAALQWTAGGNQTTDRNMTVTVNGATIDASPTGTGAAVTFSGTGAISFPDSGPRTITFTATDPNPSTISNNIFGLQINDQDGSTGKTTVVKNGPSGWQFNNSNNYSGGTVINAGRIRANTATAYGSGSVTVADGGQAYVSAGNITVNNPITIIGIGPQEQPAANEFVANFGALRLAANGDNWSGPITLAGDARITARGATGAGATISGQISGNHGVEFGNIGGVTTGGTAQGVIILNNGGNNWTGTTTISPSILRLGGFEQIPNGASAGNVVINGGSTLMDATFDLNGQTETINGLSSAGDLTHAVITSTNGNATLNVGDNNAGGNYGGRITGAVNFNKIGSGSQTLSGNNTYTNGTNVNGGTLVMSTKIPNGAVQVNGGRLAVAAKGTANSAAGTSVIPSLSINPGASLDLANNSMVIDYNDPIGTQISDVRDHLRNGRLITSSGTATTRLGYGDNEVLHKTSFGGVSVDSSSVLIKYTYAGDADLDGDADGVDIGTWATNFTGELGGTGDRVWTQGDWDYDGDVDGVDAGLWAQAFTGELGGNGLGDVVIDDPNIAPGAAAILNGMGITVVPEPAAVGLLAGIGALAMSHRRCRRRKA
jgi:autotransporter-associated beta strand protein